MAEVVGPVTWGEREVRGVVEALNKILVESLNSDGLKKSISGLKAGEDYVIYLGTRSHGETALRYKIHGTSASITRLTAGTRYYFEVALVAGGQTSNRSAEVSTVGLKAKIQRRPS